MSPIISSSRNPDEVIQGTAAERVYRDTYLLEIIAYFVESEDDLVSLALVSKAGFAIPAAERHRETSQRQLATLFKRGCDLVSDRQ